MTTPSLTTPSSTRRAPLQVLWLLGLAIVVVLSVTTRFYDLSRSAVRSDEINFLTNLSRDQSLVELWKNPPWLNQIPLADSLPIVWAKVSGQPASEKTIRQPFALLGVVSVLFCTMWMMWRRGVGAGLVLGIWMSLLPYHLYHSREAYYYILVMAFSSGMCLRGVDFLAKLKSGKSLTIWEFVEYSLWTLMACLSHMSAWVLAGALFFMMGFFGWKGLPKSGRRRHLTLLLCAGVALGLLMSRWVWRAISLSAEVSKGEISLIGSDYTWVVAHVIPVFVAGFNPVGFGLLFAILGSVVYIFLRRKQNPSAHYSVMATIAVVGLLGSCAYIYAAGGDKAKLTYFAVNLPAFLAFAAFSLDRAFACVSERHRLVLNLGAAGILVALLAFPAWQVMRLEGKPTAYRQLRAWLDDNLETGDVVIVDRWLEPWNEMALYAPSNVTVSFTVPDEPYEHYVGLNWRKTTQTLFERNEAQAFIRLTRNQENRVGLWTWPETGFARRTVLAHREAIWLRDSGFAPSEEYYTEKNRLEIEIFYDTHSDVAERARAAGKDAVWFFGAGWRLFKPWQQGDFSDYRMLEGEGSMTIHNLRDVPLLMRCDIVAVAVGGDVRVRVGDSSPLAFTAGRLEPRTFDVQIQPGIQTLNWKNLSQGGTLFLREFRLQPRINANGHSSAKPQ